MKVTDHLFYRLGLLLKGLYTPLLVSAGTSGYLEVYEIRCNNRIDPERYLDPAQTNYEHDAFYSTFDITHLLREGENCLGVMTGNGWFAQNTGWHGAPFSYGVPMLLRLQLVVDYSDGIRIVSGSDENWTWQNGPVVKSNIYLGECYDARKEVAGWSEPGSPCSGWKAAVEAKHGIPPLLRPQPIKPIRKKQVLKARKMWQNAKGTGFPPISWRLTSGWFPRAMSRPLQQR